MNPRSDVYYCFDHHKEEDGSYWCVCVCGLFALLSEQLKSSSPSQLVVLQRRELFPSRGTLSIDVGNK